MDVWSRQFKYVRVLGGEEEGMGQDRDKIQGVWTFSRVGTKFRESEHFQGYAIFVCLIYLLRQLLNCS